MNDSYKEILIKRNTPVGNKILKGLLIALAAISIFIGAGILAASDCRCGAGRRLLAVCPEARGRV